ncbi:hypothetical protein DDF67_01280 [Caulobacter endophyticus]|uniref:Uncharacterized protein n=1 Tax=Caulobacter endophyticus TaxID=2172652 RepID=A0A2T9KDD7_9CAUL|nr:hypothetical protein DDF67_01280 [Caulobacter endophyticus]
MVDQREARAWTPASSTRANAWTPSGELAPSLRSKKKAQVLQMLPRWKAGLPSTVRKRSQTFQWSPPVVAKPRREALRATFAGRSWIRVLMMGRSCARGGGAAPPRDPYER